MGGFLVLTVLHGCWKTAKYPMTEAITACVFVTNATIQLAAILLTYSWAQIWTMQETGRKKDEAINQKAMQTAFDYILNADHAAISIGREPIPKNCRVEITTIPAAILNG